MSDKEDISILKEILNEMKKLNKRIDNLEVTKETPIVPEKNITQSPTIGVSENNVNKEIITKITNNENSINKEIDDQVLCKSCNLLRPNNVKFCIHCGYDTRILNQGEITYQIEENNDPITRQIIFKAFSFNYESILKISQSRAFTKTALQLFLIAGLINSIAIIITGSLFMNNFPSEFPISTEFVFLNSSFIIILLSFIFSIEYTLKNMEIQNLNFISSMRVSGFLSIILLIRAFLAFMYNFYLYFLVGLREDDGYGYFIIFEGISWTITLILLTTYLTAYISKRGNLSKLFVVIFLILCFSFTNTLYITIIIHIIDFISRVPYLHLILGAIYLIVPVSLNYLMKN